MALRDRFDIVPMLAGAETVGQQQPFGGTAQITTRYPIAAVRIDNYTNRWLLFDSERFIVPPFTHGFVINLHTQQASATFKSIRNPFKVRSFTPANSNDPNPKIVNNPFPVGILISLYDEVQPQLPPQSLVRIDNALVEPAAQFSGGTDGDVKPVTFIGGGPAVYGSVGSLALPTISTELYFLQDARGAQMIGSRGPSNVEAASVAVAVAPAWTTLPVAMQPFQSGGITVDRLLSLLISTDVAGRVSVRNQFGANNAIFSAFLAVNVAVEKRYSPPGYWIDQDTASLQAQHSVGGNVAVTVEWGVE